MNGFTPALGRVSAIVNGEGDGRYAEKVPSELGGDAGMWLLGSV